MKKTAVFFYAFLLVFLFASCQKTVSDSQPLLTSAGQTGAFVAPTDTKIFNDFADALPAFQFKNTVIESYDESLSYEFTVKSNNAEFERYVVTLKNSGFNTGTEGAPVSGEGYYKATNSDRYMVEAVLRNGTDLTVTVTRP